MTSFWSPKNSTFWAFLTIFLQISDFNYNMKITQSNHGGDCSLYSGDFFKTIFPKFLTKQLFLSILDKFWQISAFNLTIKPKLPPKTCNGLLIILMRLFETIYS